MGAIPGGYPGDESMLRRTAVKERIMPPHLSDTIGSGADGSQIPEPVREAFPELRTSRDVEFFGGAGGFSGALFWRVTTATGMRLCVRQWPREHPTEARLRLIHDSLIRVRRAGLECVPMPCPTADGETFCIVAGHFWEVTDWMPGTADFHQAPRRARLENALTALARFHIAVGGGSDDVAYQSAPAILQRQQMLQQLMNGEAVRIRENLSTMNKPFLEGVGARILSAFERSTSWLAQALDAAAIESVPVQLAIRDVWHDHVLFTGDEVTGIVDFGALRRDTPVTDVSRLLGSLVGDDRSLWITGLDAYEKVRPFCASERQILETLDISSRVLSGMNWLVWLAIEGRVFEDLERVRARLESVATAADAAARTVSS